MTSPSQLHYLKAMGIPVWVSRERVIDETEDVALLVKSNQHTSDHSENISSNLTGTANVVENILEGLEQESKAFKASTSVDNTKLNQPSSLSAANTKQTTEIISTEQNLHQQALLSIPNVFAKTAQHTVYAQGSLEAEWMVIGQNAEFIEHEQGQPYTREEGVLLENMIRAVGISNPRSDAYLVNVLSNSHQHDVDVVISKSELNLILQDCIKQVQPKVIVIVGQLAAQNLLHSDEPLARLRGKAHILDELKTPVVVTYYPSYLLSKPGDKRKTWEDLKLAMSLVS